MKKFSMLMVALCVAIISFAQTSHPDAFGGSKSIEANQTPCIPETHLSQMLATAHANLQALIHTGKYKPAATENTVSLAWPLRLKAGIAEPGYYVISNYVDEKPGSGILDYNCGNRTYDGHGGTDIVIWPYPWTKMANKEVDVIAAASGVIIYKDDNHYDLECSLNNNSANAIIVQHTDGTKALYYHLKTGSLTAKGVGAAVSTGEFLGNVGSSGNSTGPHLHFEIRNSSDQVLDPWGGPCNALGGQSLWQSQKPYRDPRILSVTTHTAQPVESQCPPETLTAASSFQQGQAIYFAGFFRDRLVGSTASHVVKMPNGTTWDSWVEGPNTNYYSYFWTAYRILPANAPAGTWTYQITFNGQTETKQFQVNSLSSCSAPTNTNTSNIGPTSALLTWNAVPGAQKYTIIVGTPEGIFADTINLTPSSGTSYILQNKVSSAFPNGMTVPSNTVIFWKVRANCSGGNSDWSALNTFTTANASCNSPAINQFSFSNVTNSSFTVNCTASGTSKRVRYRKVGYGWHSGQTFPSNGNTITITGLSCGTTYDVEVAVRCGTTWSTYSAIKRITTGACANALLTVSPSNVTVSAAAGTTSFSINSNAPWTVTENASWLTCSPLNGSGNGTIMATYQANSSPNPRVATITVSGAGLVYSVTLTQAGTGSPTCSNDNEPANNTSTGTVIIPLNADKLSQIAFSGDQDYWKFTLSTPQNITVTLGTLPADYDLKVYNSSGSQIGSSTHSGSSSESISLNNLAIGTYYALVYGYNGANSTAQCYTLRVNGTASNTLSVTPSSLNVAATNGTSTLTVNANVPWTITDNASWLTIAPVSGTNNGQFTATYLANTGTNARSATITIVGAGLSQSITLTQAGISGGCSTPNNLSTSNITQTSITASWASVPGVLNYGLQTQSLPNGNWVNTSPSTFTGTSITINNFAPGSPHAWRVRANCSNGQSSAWSNGVTFTTLPASCSPTNGLQSTNITQNTVTVSWNSVSGATGYQIQFLLNGSWTDIGGITSSLSKGIVGLVPNRTYQWRVITICSNNQQSSPSASVSFATPTVPNCTGGNQYPATALTPSGAWKYQPNIWGGEYPLVNVTSGTTYTFSYCSADGASLLFDGQISVRSTNDELLAYSDDACGNAPKVVWPCNFTGQVRVLLNKYSCQSQQTLSTIAYKTGNGFGSDDVGDRVSDMEWAQIPFDNSPFFASNQAVEPESINGSNTEVFIFPNPASGHFNLKIERNITDQPILIQIFDQLGRMVWDEHCSIENGAINRVVDATSWDTGVYLIKFNTPDGEVINRKVSVFN